MCIYTCINIYIYSKGQTWLVQFQAHHIARSGATSTTCCRWALARPLCDGGPPLLGAFGARVETAAEAKSWWKNVVLAFDLVHPDIWVISLILQQWGACFRKLEIPQASKNLPKWFLFTPNHLPSAHLFNGNGSTFLLSALEVENLVLKPATLPHRQSLIQVYSSYSSNSQFWAMFYPMTWYNLKMFEDVSFLALQSGCLRIATGLAPHRVADFQKFQPLSGLTMRILQENDGFGTLVPQMLV